MSAEAPKQTPEAIKKEEKEKTEEKTKTVEKAKMEEKAKAEAKSPEPPKKEEKKPQEKENEKPAEANGETASAEAPKVPTLREQFKAFSKFGDTKSDGKHLTLSQSDKWMKQAKVIDKTITTTDTAIHFKKFKQMKIVYTDYDKYLQDLAKAKKIEVVAIKTKLRSCGLPGTTGTTAVIKSSAVDRLTDTKKFTGSHKIRVDPKGKASPNAKK